MDLKTMLNQVLGQSGFIEQTTFFTQNDPDSRQMVAFANRAADEMREFYPWGMIRKSASITLEEGKLSYDLPEDFDFYLTETMWKSFGARHVVIPTSDRYWAFIKAGNPGTRINYYAKFIQGKLEFTAVNAGDVINFDYQSKHAIVDDSGNTKEHFTSDSDTFLLHDSTLIIGTKAYWLMEKEIPAGQKAEMDFREHLKIDVGRDAPAKVIRHRPWGGAYTPYAPPISADYLW